MNPFSPGDRVQCKAKNRRNGNVIHIYCNTCEPCKEKRNHLCYADKVDQNYVIASFKDPTTGNNKRYRYDYKELELEPPLPIKPEEKTYDLSPKDIRPLGSVSIDVPLIASNDDVGDDGLEVDNSKAMHNENQHTRTTIGMFFDQYTSIQSKMDRPI